MVRTTASDSDAVVVAEHLTKTFRDFWGRPKAHALRDVSFSIAKGQVFGLLGPNGSGKSTTVKLILGLLNPTRGNLKVMGASSRDVMTKRRIGYLPEESYLYHYLTAKETLHFFAALFGIAAVEREDRGNQLLDMVGLSHAAGRRVGEFSKGMARRLGLAQALVNDPDLVILDEPTAGLDPIGCREVKNVIRILAERGKTVILCSHLLADVQDVCDEIIVLYGGRSCAAGTVSSLLAVEGETLIRLRHLPESKVAEIVAVAGTGAVADGVSVERPVMSLENFFISVVEKARAVSSDNAGATIGGEVAGYLRGAGRLERLTGAGESMSVGEVEVVEENISRDTEARLSALSTNNSQPLGGDSDVQKGDVDAAEDARKASERLRSLLNDGDKI